MRASLHIVPGSGAVAALIGGVVLALPGLSDAASLGVGDGRAVAITTAATTSAAGVTALRVGRHKSITRMVVDLTGPTDFTYDVAEDGHSMTFHFRDIQWHPPASSKRRHGAIAGYAFVADSRRRALTVYFRGPTRVNQMLALLPKGRYGHRIVVDLGRARTGATAAKGWRSGGFTTQRARSIAFSENSAVIVKTAAMETPFDVPDEIVEFNAGDSTQLAALPVGNPELAQVGSVNEWLMREATNPNSQAARDVYLKRLTNPNPAGEQAQIQPPPQQQPAQPYKLPSWVHDRPTGAAPAAASEPADAAPTPHRSFSVMGEDFSLSVTPRFQYFIRDVGDFNKSATFQSSSEHVQIPFSGVTVELNPHSLKNFSFLLSGFHGQDVIQNNTAFIAIDSTFGAQFRSKSDIRRTDVEFLVRQSIADSQFNLSYGGRWIRYDDFEKAPERTNQNTTLSFTETGSRSYKLRTEFLLAQLGAGFGIPITDDGKHVLFGGVTFGLGHQVTTLRNALPSANGRVDFLTSIWDMNIGYQYALTEQFRMHARYRALVGGSVSLEEDDDDGFIDLFEFSTAGHGPEIGMTYTF